MHDIKKIAVLGSTGSIGVQSLDIIEAFPDRFRATVLTARKNWELLALQARKFQPQHIVIADDKYVGQLKEALRDLPIQIHCGSDAIPEVASLDCVDTVITAMVGYSGVIPTVEAIKAGKTIALANKETLVVAGEIITALKNRYGVQIIPVDSEHSAIYQCLVGERLNPIEKIILTASGGPFRLKTPEELEAVTVEDALHHPNWNMGAKVTIDSASMMNKGFEMIEARWLFDCPPEKIEIAVHPQSIVHSMVEFADGSIKAQLGLPDMHLPIGYALSTPYRLPLQRPKLRMPDYSNLTFEAPDMKKFPLLKMAFEAISAGGNVPCILNAANEVAVAAFLRGYIRFTDIPKVAEKTIESTDFIKEITLEDLIQTNDIACAKAKELINKISNN